MADMEIILQHGWAIDSAMWSQWKESAARIDLKVNFKFAERGYFSLPSIQPVFSGEDKLKVLVVHSLGLHLVSEGQIESSDLLVIVGGFSNFHDGSERESKVSRISVQRMLHKLPLSSDQVIADFYARCGFPSDLLHRDMALPKNLSLIFEDLELLNQSKFNPDWFVLPKDVLILHGENDAIAPVRHARRLTEISKRSSIQIHKDGNHALPYLDPSWCLEKIRAHCLVAQR
jgi:pimeloyl-ACP methyl ester carboxylesterase